MRPTCLTNVKAYINTITICGRRTRILRLYEIREALIEEQRDSQGGSEFELVLFLRSGERFRMLNGHLCAVPEEYLRVICRRLELFLRSISLADPYLIGGGSDASFESDYSGKPNKFFKNENNDSIHGETNTSLNLSSKTFAFNSREQNSTEETEELV